jgi:hypothetical protein
VVIAKREMYFLIIVAALGTIALVDYFLISPYMDNQELITKGELQLKNDLADDHNVFVERKAKQEIMKKLLDNGLQRDPELVEAQTMNAILAWSQLAGVDVKGQREGKNTKQGSFVVINYDLTLEGNMSSLSKLLWALEKSPIPLRISELTFTPAHGDGVDDLNAHLQVSALSLPQDAPTVSAAADIRGGNRL